MQITIYKNTVKEIFQEISDLQGSEYSMENICTDIAKDFQNIWYQVNDSIHEKINEMVTNYIIDFKRKYDVMNSVETMVYDMVEQKSEKMKQNLLDRWEELPEFSNHKKEIEYLKNPENIKKILGG